MAAALCLGAVPAADAATPRLDTRFGKGGIARVQFRFAQTAVEFGRPLRPLREPDGKMLVAAAATLADRGPTQTILARFTRSGRPDPTFGHGGRARLGLPPGNFEAHTLQLQPDGRILVLGATGYNHLFYGGPGQLGLVRLLPDGSRDRTFGTNGLVAWNPPWPGEGFPFPITSPALLVQQGDGGLLAAGVVHDNSRSGQRVAFVRFKENGSVDESFGQAGSIEALEGQGSSNRTWAALSDGHLAALASRNEAGGPAWWLHRFTPAGALDRGFGQDGSVRLGLKRFDGVSELVPARDGAMVMIGDVDAERPDGGAMAVRRILPAGQLDARFGTGCAPPPRAARSAGAAATPDGGVFRDRDEVPHRRLLKPHRQLVHALRLARVRCRPTAARESGHCRPALAPGTSHGPRRSDL